MKTYAELKYTKKQLKVYDQFDRDDWSLMINSGAVGSGKTVIDNDLFLRELIRIGKIARMMNKKAQYILAGFSSKTIANNVLQEIMQAYPMLNIKFDVHGAFDLFGVRVVQAYTGTIAGMASIRGMNAWGAYINEMSLANEQAFTEIRNRVRGFEGARIIGDTNPDVPTHWLKRKYIDKADDKHKGIIYNHFTMDDNTFLPKKYIHDMKAQMSGMFYDRSVLGLWVAGEGLVYSDFDKKLNVINRSEFEQWTADKELTYYAGVDWGFEHKGVIVVLADDDDGNTYLIQETTKQHQQIDYWIDVARAIQAKYGYNIPFYCDSARPEYVTRFQNEHFNAFNAYKTRLTGVEELAGLIKQHRFLAVSEALDKFLDELYQYTWDERTGEPIKLNDDVMDATRYARATRTWKLAHNNQVDLNEQTRILEQNNLIMGDDSAPWM
ncbi:terminase (plasmid) [Lactobacillus paracollinoides] [Lactiplantibacillus mudanjiangensis]|uniref:PBSX family phage terminase large subunit n=1 Tax=Lactiplantibacillus mudanjiangensis TaxID=1296538 RepID=UPI001013F29E|nr:terminase (plasmid) [Lactobacillus paracollinoides] [Lactiplantibacillus mudanjiangensis]